MRERTNRLKIKTPEGVVFSLLLAGPISRFLAWALDLGCILVLTQTTNTIIHVLDFISHDLAMAISILTYFLVSIGYGIVLEWFWRGQTLGKRLLRLRVLDAQGLRLQFSQVVVRNLLRFVDSLPALYMVGGLTCLISRQAQRLGDIAANTIVVRHPRIHEPDLDQLLSGKYNSFHRYPHLEARLRQRATPREAGMALHALLRREDLDPGARIGLYHDLAEYFREMVSFPEEATQGISDEQYLRNVVDVLFRSGHST